MTRLALAAVAVMDFVSAFAVVRRVLQAAHDGDVDASIDELEEALTEYDEAVAELAAREMDETGAGACASAVLYTA